MTKLNLILQPLQQGLAASGAFDLYVLLRVQAPERPKDSVQKRTPLHLAVVLDRSGSMSGQPLHQACRCASAIAERLVADDQLALVAYDNRVNLVRPCGPVVDLPALQSQIHSISSGGSTNLHGGWAAGVEALRKAHLPGVISRVLLLSDGAANDGITDLETLSSAAKAAAAEGVSTSTYGLGRDFEEGLMTAMAKQGSGRSYYGDLAEDLLDPFMEEFDLLSNLVARKLTVSFDTQPGSTLTQVNGYPVLESGHWLLPDLAYQAEAWALFRIQGTAAGKPGGNLDLGQIKVTWQDTKGHPADALMATFSLPTLSHTDALALPKDPLVASRLSELRIGKLQELAYQAAAAGDWELVRTYIDEMKALAVEHPWSKSVVDELSALLERREHGSLTKELMYGFTSSSGRLADLNEDVDCLRPSPSSYTRRKPRQGKAMPNPEAEPPKDDE
jgi:Ca-activated chloride channel family protein